MDPTGDVLDGEVDVTDGAELDPDLIDEDSAQSVMVNLTLLLLALFAAIKAVV